MVLKMARMVQGGPDGISTLAQSLTGVLPQSQGHKGGPYVIQLRCLDPFALDICQRAKPP